MPYKSKKKRQEAWKRWYENNKETETMRKKNHARYLAKLEHSELQGCSIKGCSDIGEKHHIDYTKPTEIIWLCHKHHGILHRSTRTCDFGGCDRRHEARGLCHTHYTQWIRAGKPENMFSVLKPIAETYLKQEEDK